MVKIILRLIFLIILSIGAFCSITGFFSNDDPAWLCVAMLLGKAVKDLADEWF